MTTRKVKDVVNLINGYPFSTEDWSDHGYKIVRIQNLNDSSAKYNRTQKNVADKYYINLGDILISWAATLGIYEWNDEKAILNQHIYKVEFISDEILKDYFKYVINIAINELTYKMRGGGIKHLTKGMLDEYEFILPNIEEQYRIVSKLNIVQELIEQRQKSIELLDEYLKSTFLEMFGDPGLNPLKWKTTCFQKLATIETNQVSPEELINYDYYIGLENIVKDSGVITNSTVEINELKSSKFSFNENHILYAKLRPNLNKVALPDSKGICSTDIYPILIKDEECTKYFLTVLMRSDFFVREMTLKSTGGNLPRVSKAVIESCEVYHPPLSIQELFSNKYTKVEKHKKEYINSLELLYELFQSLQYNLFNKKEKQDEIDEFIDDEFKVDELLKSIISFTDKTEQQYNTEKDLLFRILEHTENINKEDKEYLKGIVLKFDEKRINVLTNKEDKFSR